MSDTDSVNTNPSSSNSLPAINFVKPFKRLQKLVFEPAATWAEIKGEHMDIKTLYGEYFLGIAILSSLCGFLGYLMWGFPFLPTLLNQIVFFLLSCLFVFLGGIILSKLAKNFEASPSDVECSKLLVFSSYPGLFGGILSIIPFWLAGLVSMLCSFYGIYLYWLGTQLNLGVPRERWVGFFFVSIIVLVVVFGLLGMIVTAPLPSMYPSNITIPGL